ncbi:MAG: hypothetical protein JST96_08510 [Bacteroidetes bacterium]|nr:hypothetical protein [Bacteroidota bacterium]
MRNATLNCFLLIITAIGYCGMLSCSNRTTEIPFPASDSGYAQPKIVPLVFSGEKKMNFVTVKAGAIKPSVKTLDLTKLPVETYDRTEKRMFSKKPEEKPFNIQSLAETDLDISKIASKKIAFKTIILPPPVVVKAAPLSPKSGTPLSIMDVGKLQGLSSKYILCLFKDREGFIWIGTSKGLFRYDGEYMIKYDLRNGLSVLDMVEDNDGKMWLINKNGFGVIDFKTHVLRYTFDISAHVPNLPRMTKDSRGQLWLAQIDQPGTYVIDTKTETYRKLDSASGFPAEKVFQTAEDKNKNIWISTAKGVLIFNPQTNKLKHIDKENGLSGADAEAIMCDRNDNIWVGYYDGGIDEINVGKGVIKSYGELQGVKNKDIYSLKFDKKGGLWMGTHIGLVILDTAKSFAKYFPKEDGINDDFVLGLLFDDRGRAWVGTYQTGLYVMDRNATPVYPVGARSMSTIMEASNGTIWYGTASDGIIVVDENKNTVQTIRKEQGLSDNAMQGLWEDANKNIYITSGGGFDVYDPRHKLIERIGKKEGFVSDTIYSLLIDHLGNFWLTGPSEGVEFIDSAKTTIRHAGVQEGLNDYNIQDVKEDKQGSIWLVTGGAGGVDIYDPSSSTVKYLNNLPGLKDTCFRLMMPDSKGRMWIGTDKGIYIADPKEKTVTILTTEQGLPNNYVVSMNEHNGNIIANTKNKAAVITPPKETNGKWHVALLAKSEPLIKSAVTWNSDLITKDGRFLWGDNGVAIIDTIQPQQDSAVTFITGITVMSQPQYFTNTSTAEASSVDTSATVKPNDYKEAGFSDNNKFSWDSLQGPYNLPVNLSLPYDQNYLQFQYAQHHSGRQDTTYYCYILEGIDKHWSPFTSNVFTENYLNLPPGHYTFKVRSKDLSGHWGKAATFNFEILPPWWKTWWAYTIYALLFFGAISGFIQYRSKRLIKENRILEEKVEHRTNQLKQSLEELKSTQNQLIQSEKMASLGELTAGIAHEIQNPLNFVNNFSDLSVELAGELKETLNTTEIDPAKKQDIEAIVDDIVQNQQKINFHGKRADAIVKGMLQHSRSNSGAKELTDINNLCDEYFRLSYHGLRAKDKSFNAKMINEFDPNVGKINVVPQDLGRVILNLITNAFYSVTEKKKLNIEGYDPTVWVSTKKINGKTEIHVKDNGMGVPQKVIDKIFQPFFTTKPVGQGTGLGLSLSYDIVKAHNGDLKVETKEGEGAEFIIQLPS